MNRPTKAQLQELLRGVGVVIFIKVTNGNHRIMTCTQNLKLIPREQHPQGLAYNLNPAILRVYSLNDGDWRSFYISEVLYAFDPNKKQDKRKKTNNET